MTLRTNEKALVKELAGYIDTNAEKLGGDALARLFLTKPSTKTYFSGYADYTAKGAKVKMQGGIIVKAILRAINRLDDVQGSLEETAVIHGQQLFVDPHNFDLFAQNLLVTLASNLTNFTPQVHCALDKFLAQVVTALSSRYR
uniref:hemoglobin subunit alpha-like n=1 Tax=Pristiophorus japonicus TaxID=55135 RepID=UPI00398F79F3